MINWIFDVLIDWIWRLGNKQVPDKSEKVLSDAEVSDR